MTDEAASTSGVPGHLSGPRVIVTLFMLAMSACVLGLVIWKAVEARNAALAQSEIDIRNLAHSLVENASHTIESADVAMSGMVDLLKYQTPRPERFNMFLANTVKTLPQLREIGVFDKNGDWRYASLPDMPQHNNSDRDYFVYHRDHADPGVRISAPLKSRLTGRSTILLSRRIDNEGGSFSGVLTASIDSEYFAAYYKTFQIGQSGGITLMRSDGILLMHWPSLDSGTDMSGMPLFQTWLKQSSVGYHKIASMFDGITKYYAYEQTTRYPLVVAVAIPEDSLLANWRRNLLSDIIVAAVLLCSVIMLTALLATQFRFRLNMERMLRERESRYRLLADNIADVVILLDRSGNFVFVSPSVRSVLGWDPAQLIGKSCFDLVHPDDVAAVKLASAQLIDPTATRTAIFRTYREDQSLAWVEINFKLASRAEDYNKIEVVGVLRDVTLRKTMQDELTTLNTRLAELANTDGLTGLANRRTLDGFLRREFETRDTLSVLLLDIDHFKGFNDSLGHQAGDQCLQRVAAVMTEATAGTQALAARYGGEEFAIILPGVPERQALIVAESVRLKVRALAIGNVAAPRGYLSISVGIAGRTAKTANETQLLGDADRALYEAKRRGRDCSVLHSAIRRHVVDTGLLRNG